MEPIEIAQYIALIVMIIAMLIIIIAPFFLYEKYIPPESPTKDSKDDFKEQADTWLQFFTGENK